MSSIVKPQDESSDWLHSHYGHTRLVALYDRYIVPNMGITLTLMSQFFNSLMILFCKVLLMDRDFDEPMHPFQILFIRMSMTYVLCALYLVVFQRNPDFPFGPKGYRLMMVYRGLGGFVSVAGQYCALMYLTMSDTIVITFLGPTVTGVLAYYFLRERFTKPEALGGLVALIGVTFIARPSFIFGSAQGTDSTTAGTEDGATTMDGTQGGAGRSIETSNPYYRLLGSALALSATFGQGVAMCAIRKIGFHAHALLSVSFFALITCVISFFGIIVTPGVSFQMPHNGGQWTLLISLGVAGFVMQFLLTSGMQREKAARAIAMSYSQLIYASVFDVTIFGHWPCGMSLLGEAIIIGAMGAIIYFKEDPDAGPSDVERQPEAAIALTTLDIDKDDD